MVELNKKVIVIFLMFLLLSTVAQAQEPYRVGTTVANFLELGYGSAAIAMGDAYVSNGRDISSIYWNPAGLGYMRNNEFIAMNQSWFADIQMGFVAIGIPTNQFGTFALGMYYTSYGEEKVTSMLMQEGTGENFDGLDYAVSLSYGRNIVRWFSFGISLKYIASRIWHESASAMAMDLGVNVNTSFLSPTGNREDGLCIGMSISNYGTKMKYDGIDLKRPIDEAPEEAGNFAYVPARYETVSWELPLIFRIGVSMNAIRTAKHQLILAIDAIHPNNNSEYVNLGTEYSMALGSFGKMFLRGGYKGLFMVDSQFGMTLGFGFRFNFMNNKGLKIDYAYRDIGMLGKVNTYTVGIIF